MPERTDVSRNVKTQKMLEAMNRVSQRIRDAEHDVAPVFREFFDGRLSIRKYDGKTRILLDDKPLIEHKFDERLEHLEAAEELAQESLSRCFNAINQVGEGYPP